LSIARKGSHSVFSIQLHFVFVTKYRKKVINAPILDRMHEIFANICVKTVASSGGAPIEKLKQYIKDQDAPTK
jgi:REP element-mobilizing transposase RayT